MADFLLSVGVDVGLSYDQMQQDISSLITQLNQNPQRVQIGLEIDQGAIDRFKTEITNIHNSMGGFGRVTVNPVDTTGLNNAVDGVARMAQNAQGAISAVQTMRAELNSVNAERIQQAIASINGISAQGAVALAQSLSEVNVRAGEVTAVLSEAANAEQQLVSLAVRGTDAHENMVNYLMTYNTETGEIDRRMLRVTARIEDSAAAEASRVITVREITDLYRQMHALMRTNTNANTTASYAELANQAELLNNALSLAQRESISIDEAFNRLGVSGTSAISSARDAMSAFRLEMEQTGSSGAVSMTTLYDTVYRMQTLLNNNAGYANLETYTNLQTQVTSLSQAIELVSNGGITLEEALTRVGLNGSTAIGNAREAMSAFKAEMSGATSSTEVLTQDNAKYATSMEKVNALLRQIKANTENWTKAKNGRSSEQYRIYADQARELENLAQQLSQGKMTLQQFNTEYERIKLTADNAATAMKGTGEATQSLGQRIGKLSAKFGTWFSITRVIMAAYRAIRQMVTASIELQDAFTQLKIVTGASDDEMKQFSATAIDLAKSLGRSVTEVTNSIEVFSRLGYSLDDASKLAEYATILSNVAAVDTNAATTGLTSIIKGFNLDVSETAHVADVLVAVGQKYAVSAEELMEAFEKSGAALNASNTSFEKSAGLIAAANASVQNASTVGTALKTVSARIRGSKSDLEELGEDTSELAEGFSKYAKEIKALTGFNIMVEGTTDQFKDIYDIFEGISAVWGKLSDTQQARVSEILGGTRQLQVISYIIGNWSDATDAYATAMDAAGVATNANNIYMQTATAHIEQFKATFQEFGSNLITSGLITTIVDIGTGIITILNGLQKVHLMLPILIGLIATIKGIGLSRQLAATTQALIGNKVATESLIVSVSKMTIAQKKKLVSDIQAAVASKTLTAEEATQILTTLNLANAEGVLTIANKGLGTSFKSLTASIPVWGWIALGISAVIEAINWLTSSVSNTEDEVKTLKEELANISSAVTDTANKFKDLNSSATDVIPRFAELAKGVSEFGENVSLTDDEYDEFLSLNNKVAEMFPELNLGMDDSGNAMLALSYSADTLTQSLWDLVKAQREAAYATIAEQMPDELETINDLQDKYKEEIDKYEAIKNEWTDVYNDIVNQSLPTKVGRYSSQEAGYQAALDLIEKARRIGVHGDVLMDDQTTTNNGYVFTVKWDYEQAKSNINIIKQLYEAELASQDKLIYNYKNKINALWQGLNPVVSAWMNTDFIFNDLNDKMQDLALGMVSGLDFSKLGITTEEDITDYITKNILDPLFLASDDAKNAFNNIFAWQDQLKSGEITTEQFTTNVQAAFVALFNSMDDEQATNFKNMLIAGFGETGDSFDDVCSRLIAGWGTVSSTSKKSLTDLSESLSALKNAYAIIATAQGEMVSGSGLSAETIKALADITDNYIDYLYEENGVIKLNIDAWKERSNIEIKNNIDSIEGTISALNTEKEAIESEIASLEAKSSLTEEETARLTTLKAELAANSEAIVTNQSKLGIYTTLYNDIAGSLDAYSAALQNFSNISNVITSVSDSLTTVADLQKTVANGFTISLEKALEFAKVYPEILNGATVAADGQIALNEGIVNAFIEGKEAELKAQIDAEVVKLEADKAVLTAKMEFSKAQLELAKSVGTGEGQISKEVAEYRVNAGNAVAQALIDAGIDESTAYQLACSAMSQNSEEFNRVASEVCTDIQGNFDQAAYDAAQSIYTNMQNSQMSIADVAKQAHETAKAIQAMANGEVAGASLPIGIGGGGTHTNKGSITVKSGSFKGTEYTYEAKTISLEDYIAKLELDISSYSQAISQIDGQIATLKALRNTSLNKFSSSNKGSGGGKDNEPTWFENEYALHQHLLEMDAENVEDYLEWLNSAYQRAYDEGIISLDDYYKYQEEVYSSLRDLFKDYLNDVEHEISMRENYKGESDKIIELYKKLIKDVEKEIAAAREQGLDDTDDYIQELQGKWQDYSESIKDIQEEATESAKDAIDELIDYRIDMIKQDIEDEKDALDKKLDYLKEFYDKQKDMLQDQYDEEQYLEEQAEKRKSVSDLRSEIAMLENDDSAWAQKRRLELQEELAAAEDDLGSFEDEHALDLALDALDNAYNAQEAQIEAEMDALEEKLNDPEALYNQALTEIKNNTGNLYQEMLEYNRKYGTGNDADVKDIYEAAYKALLEYKDIYGKDYEGVVLTNSTNYKPETGSWDTEGISGTNPNNQKPTSSSKPENDTTAQQTKTYPYGKASETSGNIGIGARGTGVKAIQYALNQLGFGNSGTQDCDGEFGSGTQKAVKAFQSAMGISSDGIVGINTRAKFKAKGYAVGTRNATPGIHAVDELGTEYIFESPSDGTRYRMFHGGEKVLNAKATDFLYEFANGGGEILEKIIKSVFGTAIFDGIKPAVVHNNINVGGVTVAGNADSKTVSEIRRAQRDNLTEMLKSLNKLNK